MPYTNFKTTLKLDEAQKTELAAGIAECVKLLPGKPPEKTMVHIEDGCSIYRDGKPADCAFMQTIFKKPLAFEDQQKYIEALYSLCKVRLGLDTPQVYFAMVDLDTWGSRGTLH